MHLVWPVLVGLLTVLLVAISGLLDSRPITMEAVTSGYLWLYELAPRA